MNQQLQALLNPFHPSKPQISKRKTQQEDSPVFRIGDRVIQTQNDYNLQIFNGDLGFVVGVSETTRTLMVEYPETDLEQSLNGQTNHLHSILHPRCSLGPKKAV